MIEVRRMRASDEELKSLVANLMVSKYTGKGGPVEKFTIFDMVYVSEIPVKVKVAGQFGDGRQVNITITPDLLVTAFIIFCVEQGVPISRTAVKSVSRIKDGVAFDMVVGHISVAPAPGLQRQIDCAFIPVPEQFAKATRW